MPTVTELVVDVGVAVDSTAYTRDFNVVDTAAGADGDGSTRGFNVSDTAAAAVVADDLLHALNTVLETAQAADALAPGITLAQTDTGAGTDALALSRDHGVSDSAAAAESLAVSGVKANAILETAIAVDELELVRALAVADTATATDALAFVVNTAVAETAHAADTTAPFALATVAVTETAQAADATAARLTATTTVADTARATDAAASGNGEAFWTNLRTMAAARWTTQPFNSFAMHHGELLAAGPSGIAGFGANTDAGTAIVARLVGDLTDFGSPERKVYDAAYMAGLAAGTMRLRVATEAGQWNYDAPNTAAKLTNVYFQLGRGLFSRFARFELTNPDGAAFTLREAVVNVAPTKRVR
jgi:hypothetical protein